MKHLTLILTAAIAIVLASCSRGPITANLMCYNVHNCVGLDDSL